MLNKKGLPYGKPFLFSDSIDTSHTVDKYLLNLNRMPTL